MFRAFLLLSAVLLFCAHAALSFSLSEITSSLSKALLGSADATSAVASDSTDLEHARRSTASTEVAFTVMIYANGESTQGMHVYFD